ncbi:MAG: DNA repair protein RecN [Candidatus Ornithospirochaeta sp.]
MLESLHVRNYVLIDSLDLDFSDGFTVITGETGSGKSIILGALSLLLGQKADKEAVRKGSEMAEVSGTFSIGSSEVLSWCNDHEIEVEDNTLVLRRVIRSNGRSTYSVNGTALNRSEGEELGMLLVDVSSQHAHQSLMKNDVLRKVLDEASSSLEALDSYRASYKELMETEDKLKQTKELMEKSSEEADYMKYCLSELENADLKVGEEEELKEKLSLQASSEYIAENLSSAQDELKSAQSSLSEALSYIRKAEKKDPSLLQYSERLESQSIETEDIFESIRDYLSSMSFSETEIEMMNQRISLIQRMKRRFGGSVEAAIEQRENFREKLELISDSSDVISSLEKKMDILSKEVEDKAQKLTSLRKKGATAFSKHIEEKLHRLGMEASVFTISVTPLSSPGPYGKDKIEYLISANKGEKTSLIQETSSGGELSRLMLAMKTSMEGSGSVDTMLFDEVDAGIGGRVATCVAKELRQLSQSKQVITITHLSQIASKADRHYKVYKYEENGRTISHIKLLDGEERVRELARILSGDESEISLEHARKMLEDRE